MICKLKDKLILVSLLFFIVSLFLNAFQAEDMGRIKDYSSLEVFLIGPISVLGGGIFEFFIWSDNIWFLISLVCAYRNMYLISMISGLIAFLISGTFNFYKEILAAENGRMAEITNLNAGYFLWLSSILWITFSSVYLKIKEDA